MNENQNTTNIHPAGSVIRWIIFGILSGVIIGAVGAFFGLAVIKATQFRESHAWIIYSLPLIGLIITTIYAKAGNNVHHGTDLVIEAIRNKEAMPPIMAPVIIVSTILTHLAGGSAGREGAALQIGGSLGSTLAKPLKKVLHFTDKDHGRIVMCGMSAAFSSIFGTPLAAVIFPLELSTVGILPYSALLPCTLSSLSAFMTAQWIGMPAERMPLSNVPVFSIQKAGPVMILAILTALISILFCQAIHVLDHYSRQYIKNEYTRTILAGVILIALTLMTGTHEFNGTGANFIEEAVMDPAFKTNWYTFLLKILFTAITISGSFKGGEIVPSFFIGAMFGRFYGPLLGIDPQFAAALGMGCMFCGITNCPLSTLLIMFELFGFEGNMYFILAVAITYLFSGNHSIYHTQIIHHHKAGIEE